ncbi:MAG: GNAT family N-acetyltransferase [bacterium]|nr:GNAT family N-acetyltransferase [bacterium]
MKATFRIIGKDRLEEIKPLWEKLNKVHLRDSRYFREHFRTFTFGKRCESFRETAPEDIRIEVLEDDKGIKLGYCISTIEKKTGEIDSLYIEESCRGRGFGKQLIMHAVEWLKKKGCTQIRVAVAEGHESVFGFYEKMGFYPRLTYLQMKSF